MPLHVHVSRFAALAARLFYRLEHAGPRPPAAGPLLVVANHPNSLLDPALVTLAVGRPARFLAKAPLFTDPKVGWLVRASGAIPVHRQQDAAVDAARQRDGAGDRTARNDDTFRAAEQALLAGDAIALFPEGISHARPALAPMKTGAARLALGAAARLGGAFPLVPVGITLDDRAVFRSPGMLVVGDPVRWDDLAAAAAADLAAGADPLETTRVRTLTARVADAIAEVTASYASWDEARLVEIADAVHAAHFTNFTNFAHGTHGPPTASDPAGPDAAGRVGRRRLGARLLARARAMDGPAGEAVRAEIAALARALRDHRRLLDALRLAPADLALPTDAGTAARWAVRRLHLLVLGGLAALGALAGWVPYRATGVVAARMPGTEESDVRATSKALVGGAAFLAWTLLLAVVAGVLAGPWAALLTLVVLPPLLVLALVTGEGWQAAWRDARRFLVLRGRAGRVAGLRARQAALAERVEALVTRLEAAGMAGMVDR